MTPQWLSIETFFFYFDKICKQKSDQFFRLPQTIFSRRSAPVRHPLSTTPCLLTHQAASPTTAAKTAIETVSAHLCHQNLHFYWNLALHFLFRGLFFAYFCHSTHNTQDMHINFFTQIICQALKMSFDLIIFLIFRYMFENKWEIAGQSLVNAIYQYGWKYHQKLKL